MQPEGFNLIGKIQPDQKMLNFPDRVLHPIGNKSHRGDSGGHLNQPTPGAVTEAMH